MNHSPTLTEPTQNTASGLAAIRTSAGLLRLAKTRFIAVTGQDRVRWLNGMITNSVVALQAGEGAYSFVLNAQGRIQADLTVWAEGDRLLLETDAAQVETLVELLDRFIIMDDVELQPDTTFGDGLLLVGPSASTVLHAAGLPAPAQPMRREDAAWQGQSVTVLRTHGSAARFEIWTGLKQTAEALQSALLQCGAQAIDESDVELQRIFEGTPIFGTDIRTKDLPQETGQQRALHFSKGCYLGQEIVERIRSRGAVHRMFTRFVLHGSVPEAGCVLLAEEKPVGELTSIAQTEINGQRFALGYIRREVVDRGLSITYGGGTAEASPAEGAS